jgi:hypothetical protein
MENDDPMPLIVAIPLAIGICIIAVPVCLVLMGWYFITDWMPKQITKGVQGCLTNSRMK